jgi:predicted nucleic acid-binding protein
MILDTNALCIRRWIASLAKEHSLPIVSRDLHFDWVRGVRRVDW